MRFAAMAASWLDRRRGEQGYVAANKAMNTEARP